MPEGDVIIYQSLRQIIPSLEPGPQLVPAEHVWKHPLPPDQTSATPNPRENPQSSCTAPLCLESPLCFPGRVAARWWVGGIRERRAAGTFK